MGKNNGGYTLAELLVSITILAVVSLAAFSLMIFGSNTYNKVSSSVDTQIQASAALEQISGYLEDCDSGVSFSGTVLTVTNSDSEYTFTYDAEADTITFDKKDSEDGGLLANGVTMFNVTFDTTGGRASSATLTVSFLKNGREKQDIRVVSLRNRPSVS